MNPLSLESLAAYWSVAAERGYTVAEGSIADLAHELTIFEGVETFHLSHVRN